MLATTYRNHVCDPEQCHATKDEIAPLSKRLSLAFAFGSSIDDKYLVGRLDQRADQTGDDHHLVHQESEEDGGPRKRGGQQQIQEQQWCGNEPWSPSQPTSHHRRPTRERKGEDLPIDISNIEDLAGEARHLRIPATKLHRDTCLAQVGSHGEVGDGRDEGDADGDVVKHPMGAWFGEGVSGKGECRCQHQGTHGLCIR